MRHFTLSMAAALNDSNNTTLYSPKTTLTSAAIKTMLSDPMSTHRKRRTALLCVAIGVAALSIQSILTPHLQLLYSVEHALDNNNKNGGDEHAFNEEGEIDDEQEEVDNNYRRLLLSEEFIGNDAHILSIPGEEPTHGMTLEHPNAMHGNTLEHLSAQLRRKRELNEQFTQPMVMDNAEVYEQLIMPGEEEVRAVTLEELNQQPPSPLEQLQEAGSIAQEPAAEHQQQEDAQEENIQQVDPNSYTDYTALIDSHQPLPPYTISHAIDSTKMYDKSMALLIYDPSEDLFYAMYSKRHFWASSCEKMLNSFKHLVILLRKIMPDRFMGVESDELVIPISSGDYPGVRKQCLEHYRKESTNPNTPPGWKALLDKEGDCSHNVAPILHFGSVFRQPFMFPSMIGMPMPVPHHLYCFTEWAFKGSVCKQWSARGVVEGGELVFGDVVGLDKESRHSLGLEYDDLIPQVVWRGTDFSYLTNVQVNLKKPTFDEKMVKWPLWDLSKDDRREKRIGGLTVDKYVKKRRQTERIRLRAPARADKSEQQLANFNKAAVVHSLRGQYKNLLPRWQAVLLTAEAEATAANEGISGPLPWANMKFSNFVDKGVKTQTTGAENYSDWEMADMATGEYMALRDLAKYKYQIDLAGGGGTTWSGTIQKLAMPGLLFHHMTPTKDYIHDWMEPWVHFVPVSSDLRDLHRKFEWAEAHPEEAKKIADEGAKLMRYFSLEGGFQELFEKDMVQPLQRVVEAYQPVKTIGLRTWREALRRIEGDDTFVPLVSCGGIKLGACKQFMGKTGLKKALSPQNSRHFFSGFLKRDKNIPISH